MIHPSGVDRPEDVKVEAEQVQEGMYVVKNAYEGDYKYFPDKVLIENCGDLGEDSTGDAQAGMTAEEIIAGNPNE